ncbi:hypothetical protein HDV00_008678 [Rhizophlyctis rosea]|nr:hypothetical protein HDV00_008678 [Rhizophlyctis rosea]
MGEGKKLVGLQTDVDKQPRSLRAVESSSPLQSAPVLPKSNIVGRLARIDRQIFAVLGTNIVVGCICVLALVYGLTGKVVVRNDSVLRTFSGWCIGFAVQAAVLPIINLGRLSCQLWFAHQLRTKGMKGREMMSAWSALYSGSFRGLEDMASGLSPIALVLMSLYVGEIVVLGAIGNLYSMEATEGLRISGTLPTTSAITSALLPFPVGEAIDRLMLDSKTLASSTYRQAMMSQSASNTSTSAICDDTTGQCTASLTGVSHPFQRTIFDIGLLNINDTWSSEPRKDEVLRSRFTSYNVAVNCRPAQQYTLQNVYPDPTTDPYFQVFSDEVFPDGSTVGTSIMVSGVSAPELGFLPFVNFTTDGVGRSYVSPKGALQILVYARNLFDGTSKQFAKLTNNLAGFSVEAAVCDVVVLRGEADGVIRFPYVDPEIITAVEEMELAVPQANLLVVNRVILAIVSNTVARFNCYFQTCSGVTTVPWFDSDLGFLSNLPQSAADYDSIMGGVTQALAELILGMVNDVSIPSQNSVPFQIASQYIFSTLNITTACSTVLFLGISCAAALAVLYSVYAFGLSRDPKFSLGVKMTDSIYEFLGSLEAPVASSTSAENVIQSTLTRDVGRSVKDKVRSKKIRLEVGSPDKEVVESDF